MVPSIERKLLTRGGTLKLRLGVAQKNPEVVHDSLPRSEQATRTEGYSERSRRTGSPDGRRIPMNQADSSAPDNRDSE